MQDKRTRATDSRGRPVPGLYVRGGRFIAGWKRDGRWSMRTLEADTLTDARRERDALLAGLRDGRIAGPSAMTFADAFSLYQNSRSLAERTRRHEQHLRNRHLPALSLRRIQEISANDVAKVLHGMRDSYSAWTGVAVYRIMAGTFALALRRGVIAKNPMDGLAPSERPKQRNAKKIAVLGSDALGLLVSATKGDRWKAAVGLAGYAGLRLGEVRGLQWLDVDFDENLIHVRRSLLPDGTPKATKTEAGTRAVPMLPALRRLLVTWKVGSGNAKDNDLVIATVDGAPTQERNLRRVLDDAKIEAGMTGTDQRLSWHSLRHSFASMLATDLELPATTLARLTGHKDAGFTLKVYARDGRDEATVVADVLARAAGQGVGK